MSWCFEIDSSRIGKSGEILLDEDMIAGYQNWVQLH